MIEKLSENITIQDLIDIAKDAGDHGIWRKIKIDELMEKYYQTSWNELTDENEFKLASILFPKSKQPVRQFKSKFHEFEYQLARCERILGSKYFPKMVHSDGKIEIERVIDGKGDAMFRVRIVPTQNQGPSANYHGETSFLFKNLVMGNVRYIPVVDATITMDNKVTRSTIKTNIYKENEAISKDEFINLP